MHIGLIGYGYWGVNLLRNLIESKHIDQISVCDKRAERLKLAKKIYPDINTSYDSNNLIFDKSINAIIIATPVSSHFELAKLALLNNKHVLVEKPMCTSGEEALELIHLAESRNLIIMVDHTFLYNGAIRLIKEKIDSGKIGKLKYIDSTRINLGIYQQDTNVIWDLASHDISIIQLLVDEKPTHIRAIGQYNSNQTKEDISYIFLHYASGLLVQINTSWASPVKIRQMIIGGEREMIIFDDIEPTDKIKVYNFAPTEINDEKRKQILIDYRLGDITIPKFSTREPLKNMMDDFFESIHTGITPFSSSQKAFQIIQILEKAELSLQQNGALIPI